MARTPDPETVDPNLVFNRPTHDPQTPEGSETPGPESGGSQSGGSESPEPESPGRQSRGPNAAASISAALKARRVQAEAKVRKPRRKPNTIRAPMYKPSGGRKRPAIGRGKGKGKGPTLGKGKGPTLGKVRGARVAKPKRRARPGSKYLRCLLLNIVRALREIKHYQKTTGLVLSQLPFQRLVREVTADFNPNMRYQRTALLALQEATEHILTTYFELMYSIPHICC